MVEPLMRATATTIVAMRARMPRTNPVIQGTNFHAMASLALSRSSFVAILPIRPSRSLMTCQRYLTSSSRASTLSSSGGNRHVLELVTHPLVEVGLLQRRRKIYVHRTHKQFHRVTTISMVQFFSEVCQSGLGVFTNPRYTVGKRSRIPTVPATGVADSHWYQFDRRHCFLLSAADTTSLAGG